MREKKEELEIKSKEKLSPNVELNIVFSQHFNKQGLEKFKELFKDSDVIFFELRGWSDGVFDFYNDVSKGKIKKEEIGEYIEEGKSNRECLFREYIIRRLEIIHNSQKPIFLTDIKYRSKEWNEYLKLEKLSHKFSKDSKREYINGKFNKAVELSKKLFNFEVKRNNFREKIIVREILKAIDRVKKDRNFKNKKEVKILAMFGRAHYCIIKQLKKKIKKGDNVEINMISDILKGIKSFNEAIMIGSEIIIRKTNNTPIKDSEYIRAILEELFLSECCESSSFINNKIDELVLATRKMVEKLSYDDLRKISEFKITTDEGSEKLSDFLESRGLPRGVPNTKEKLEQILGKDDKFD